MPRWRFIMTRSAKHDMPRHFHLRILIEVQPVVIDAAVDILYTMLYKSEECLRHAPWCLFSVRIMFRRMSYPAQKLYVYFRNTTREGNRNQKRNGLGFVVVNYYIPRKQGRWAFNQKDDNEWSGVNGDEGGTCDNVGLDIMSCPKIGCL